MSLARFAVNIGFLERPIVAGLLWGAATGDFATALPLALFYELFWLDLFPVGTYLPPNALFPLFTVLAIASTMHQPDAATLFLPILFTLPLGFFGAYVEKIHRLWQVFGYERLLRGFRSGSELGMVAGNAVALSILQFFLLNGIVFFAVAALCIAADTSIRPLSPLAEHNVTWPFIWIFGIAGGILSLRIRRGYIVFLAGSACIGFFALFGIALR